MNLRASYFAVGNPIDIFDKWLNPYLSAKKYKETIKIRGKDMTIEWTERANQALLRREKRLIIEMQLYFTCVVKKRVLFLENILSKNYQFEGVLVNDLFSIAFHTVEAESCNPNDFANDFPVKRKYDSSNSLKMRPSHLEIDFKRGDWVGVFNI